MKKLLGFYAITAAAMFMAGAHAGGPNLEEGAPQQVHSSCEECILECQTFPDPATRRRCRRYCIGEYLGEC